MPVKNVKVDDFENSTLAYFEMIKHNKPLNKQEEQVLWYHFKEKNDLSAREKLIKANLKFVPSIAKQFRGCGLPFADIIEEGNIGLIKAIDRFNPQRDTKVISYAVWWIRKSIMEAIEKKSLLNAENIDDIYKPQYHEDNSENDIPCKNIIMPAKDIVETNDTSCDIKQVIEELFDGIPDRERYIISDYYGLYGDSPRTLDEIGEEFNLTKERIRQLNEKALKKMRSNALIKNLNFNGF